MSFKNDSLVSGNGGPTYFHEIKGVGFLRLDIDTRGDVYMRLLMGDIVNRTGYYFGEI